MAIQREWIPHRTAEPPQLPNTAARWCTCPTLEPIKTPAQVQWAPHLLRRPASFGHRTSVVPMFPINHCPVLWPAVCKMRDTCHGGKDIREDDADEYFSSICSFFILSSYSVINCLPSPPFLQASRFLAFVFVLEGHFMHGAILAHMSLSLPNVTIARKNSTRKICRTSR